MKIKSKQSTHPIVGDRKTKIKFALFPIKVEGFWIWLEKYIADYEYQTIEYDFDEVVSSGLFTEKYRTVTREYNTWKIVDRRLFSDKNTEHNNYNDEYFKLLHFECENKRNCKAPNCYCKPKP